MNLRDALKRKGMKPKMPHCEPVMAGVNTSIKLHAFAIDGDSIESLLDNCKMQ